MAEGRSRGSLAARLALAFIAVAVAAVAALAMVILLSTRSETTRLSDQERAATARQVAGALGRAYAAARGWSRANTSAAVALASRADAVLVVRNVTGAVVVDERPGRGAGQGPRGGGHASPITQPVIAAGRRVGAAELRFRGALGPVEQRLRDELVGAVLLGSAIAIVIALAAATLVSRRIGGPVGRLTAAARRLQAGDLSARAAQARAPGELGELARDFDAMAEALDRQERSRQRLVADLAHELRTPVAILRGNLEELIDGMAEPTPAQLGSLHEEALRLGSLVEQLDALGRAEAPIAPLETAPVDLAGLVAAELQALRPQLAAKAIAVRRELAPVTVRGDRLKLGQVIANLLSNALKFTPEGGHIDVLLGASGREARLEVSDSGPGVAPEDRPHVFERFWRGGATASVAGRGIGLAVVEEIVRAHGGAVTLDGGTEGGARFRVVLPLGD